MKSNDQRLLEEAYAKVLGEALYAPEVTQALKNVQQAVSRGQVPSEQDQKTAASHPYAACAVIEYMADLGDKVPDWVQKVLPEVVDSAKSDRVAAGKTVQRVQQKGFNLQQNLLEPSTPDTPAPAAQQASAQNQVAG